MTNQSLFSTFKCNSFLMKIVANALLMKENDSYSERFFLVSWNSCFVATRRKPGTWRCWWNAAVPTTATHTTARPSTSCSRFWVVTKTRSRGSSYSLSLAPHAYLLEVTSIVRYYSKTCLIWPLCNPFHCVIQRWFSFPFDDFLCVFHCVIRHPVYFDSKFRSPIACWIRRV